jgi:hypothetical protein
VRVLICGGRDYSRSRYLNAALDALDARHKFKLVVTGGAPGADTLADRWAEARGIDRVICPANWIGRGKPFAGPDRNRFMLRLIKPELVVAFLGGPGTANMIAQAKAAGVKVHEVPEGDGAGQELAAQDGADETGQPPLTDAMGQGAEGNPPSTAAAGRGRSPGRESPRRERTERSPTSSRSGGQATSPRGRA